MSKKVAFIGHLNCWYSDIKKELKTAIQNEIDDGCKVFTMGTHGDFDKYALQVCKDLRNSHKDLEIEVVITSLNQIKPEIYEDQFGRDVYKKYEDVKTVIYEIEEEYFMRRITESNRQMIDTCDVLICYVNEKRYRSGAKTALKYARKKSLKIINLFREEFMF